jgi:hypothetical protein
MITPKRAKVIAQRYYELCQKADRFLDSLDRDTKRKQENEAIYGMPSTIVDEDGGVLYERNTSCHCHPEYQTFKQPPEKFLKWLEEDNRKE